MLVVIAIAILATRSQKQEFAKAEERDVKTFVYGSGFVSPKVRSRVKAEVSGEVLEVLVEEGQAVKSGQILARIDQSIINSGIKEASIELSIAKQRASEDSEHIKSLRAKVESARKSLELSGEILRRREELYKEGLIAKETLERARTDYEINKKELESLENSLMDTIKSARDRVSLSSARLESLKTQSKKYEVRSPIDGVVLKREVSKGDIVQIGEALFIIGRPEWEIILEIDEEYASLVKVGQIAELRLDMSESAAFQGIVKEILPRVDRSRKLITLKVDAPIPPNTPFDASIDAKIEVKTEKVFAVPKDYYKDGSVIVFDGVRKVKVPVKLESEQGDKVLVKGSLKAGAKLVKP